MKWSWLLGALAVAGFLLVRRHRLGRWTQAAGWVVVAGAGAVGVGLVELPNLEELFLDVGRALGPWTYLSSASSRSWRPARSSASSRRGRRP